MEKKDIWEKMVLSILKNSLLQQGWREDNNKAKPLYKHLHLLRTTDLTFGAG